MTNKIEVYNSSNNSYVSLNGDSDGNLKAKVISKSKGSLANAASNISLSGNAYSSSLDVSEYTKSKIIYEDTSTTFSTPLTMYVSDDDVTYYETDIQLQPALNYSDSKRVFTCSVDLTGLKYIKFYNENIFILTNVYISVVGKDL